MVSRRSFLSVLSIALLGATVWAEVVKLEGINCVIAPKAASADKSVPFKDGKVYFCCGNCAGKFAEAPEKYTASANMQLVATHQYEQQNCPFSGQKMNPEFKTKVGDAEVGFCCAGCKAKVEAADAKAKVELVFEDKAFAKAGFAKVSE